MDAKTVGQRIKAAREKKNLTQDELAALVNISTTHMSVIERGFSGCAADRCGGTCSKWRSFRIIIYDCRTPPGRKSPGVKSDSCANRRINAEDSSATLDGIS